MQWKRERGRVLDRSFGEVVVIQKKKKNEGRECKEWHAKPATPMVKRTWFRVLF
jgi:hypothetical protein